jgi:hypothetical protein
VHGHQADEVVRGVGSESQRAFLLGVSADFALVVAGLALAVHAWPLRSSTVVDGRLRADWAADPGRTIYSVPCWRVESRRRT